MTATIAISLLAFLLAIGVLVSVHELGHYWAARACGVYVLRFSIGFGRPLWRRESRSGTEWVVAALPFGGYVKMLDCREFEVPEKYHRYEFTHRPLAQRAAIVAAGPAINLLLAAALYALVFMLGETGLRPLVGDVAPDTPAAAAGLEPGDEVLAVDGAPVAAWQDIVLPLLSNGLEEDGRLELTVRRADGGARDATLDVAGLLKTTDLLAMLGLEPMRPTHAPVLGQVTAASPAQAAGLRAGDRIRALDGAPVASWPELARALRARPGRAVVLDYARDGRSLQAAVRLDDVDGEGRLGVAPWVDPALAERLRVRVSRPLGESLLLGAERAWDYGIVTVRLLGSMLVGDATTRNLSGPIGIAEFAGASLRHGLVAFLGLLALLSLSLGILNLLPVPLLDGGHLLYLLAEFLTRRPVPARVERIGQRVGLAMLAALVGLAVYNDLLRLLG